MKTTRTKRICPSEDKERIMCCAINPFRPVLVCGLENGKLCLFQEDDDCDFIPFSDWKATIVETLSTNLVACVDWDVSKYTIFPYYLQVQIIKDICVCVVGRYQICNRVCGRSRSGVEWGNRKII